MDLEDAYREHRLALLRLAFLVSGSTEASEDAVQSVFASVHQRWDEIEKPLPYLKRAVQVEITDPADPAPYWLISTRHPDELARVLTELTESSAAG